MTLESILVLIAVVAMAATFAVIFGRSGKQPRRS
jgi:hypothetical protein